MGLLNTTITLFSIYVGWFPTHILAVYEVSHLITAIIEQAEHRIWGMRHSDINITKSFSYHASIPYFFPVPILSQKLITMH